MSVNFILSYFILFIVSSFPPSLSQSNSQQNIQTRYPFSPPPPPLPRPAPPPKLRPPPAPATVPPTVFTPPPQVPPPEGKSSTRSAVGTAIGVTAASTLVLSGLIFFFIVKNSKRRREGESVPAMAGNGGTNLPPPQADHFRRFSGNLKGVIVDENGLDVLYWRNLEAGDKKSSFKKQYYRNLKDDQKEEDRKIAGAGAGGRRKEEPVQEVPLLRGRSSTSQNSVWGEKTDQRMKKAPTVTSDLALKDDQNRAVKTSTPPLPLPPMQPVLASSAVPKGKATTVPPVPSMMPPPPLPLPPGAPRLQPSSLASGSIPKGKMPAPPRLPPSAAGASASSSVTPPAPEGVPSSNPLVKMKPLHWDKVNPDPKHSMVWDKMNKGSFKFDGDLMEALFGYVATNRKSPRGHDSSNKSGPPSQIFILDTRKSQNIAIVLKSLGVARSDLIHALIEGQGLESDTIEKLVNIAPSAEELSGILAFHGDPTRLADAESFLYHLLKVVPSAFTRFNALLFKSSYDTEISHIKESLQSLDLACKELKTRGLFFKLLEAVLKAGNRLNAGTSRGDAQAFNLTALTKLSDVKSSDGKTTLLQFVVQEVVRAEGKRLVLNKDRSTSRTNNLNINAAESQNNDKFMSKEDREREYMMLGLPVVGGLSAEFANVKRAATVDYDLLIKTSSALAAGLDETRRIVDQCGNEGGFAREMIGFLDTAELEIQIVDEEKTRVIELVKKTTDYYQTGFSSKDRGRNTLQLFVVVRDFLAMVDQVCIEIARNVQKKRPHVTSTAAEPAAAAGSSSPESPRIFRFPKLPADFMSEHSKSSSMDSGDDSGFR